MLRRERKREKERERESKTKKKCRCRMHGNKRVAPKLPFYGTFHQVALLLSYGRRCCCCNCCYSDSRCPVFVLRSSASLVHAEMHWYAREWYVWHVVWQLSKLESASWFLVRPDIRYRQQSNGTGNNNSKRPRQSGERRGPCALRYACIFIFNYFIIVHSMFAQTDGC